MIVAKKVLAPSLGSESWLHLVHKHKQLLRFNTKLQTLRVNLGQSQSQRQHSELTQLVEFPSKAKLRYRDPTRRVSLQLVKFPLLSNKIVKTPNELAVFLYELVEFSSLPTHLRHYAIFIESKDSKLRIPSIMLSRRVKFHTLPIRTNHKA